MHNKKLLALMLIIIGLLSIGSVLADSADADQEEPANDDEGDTNKSIWKIVVGGILIFLGIAALFTPIPDALFFVVPLGSALILSHFFSNFVAGAVLVVVGVIGMTPMLPSIVIMLIPTGLGFIFSHLGWL